QAVRRLRWIGDCCHAVLGPEPIERRLYERTEGFGVVGQPVGMQDGHVGRGRKVRKPLRDELCGPMRLRPLDGDVPGGERGVEPGSAQEREGQEQRAREQGEYRAAGYEASPPLPTVSSVPTVPPLPTVSGPACLGAASLAGLLAGPPRRKEGMWRSKVGT